VDATVLAFDYGEKRIGVAVGEARIGVAHPLATVAAATLAARLDAIAALIREWKPARLVVGLPLHMDGAEHDRTAQARRFAARLGSRFGLPVALVDERLTSWEADSHLVAAGVTGRRRKAARDQVAAQLILQAYFAGDAPRS
jgi:putative Holliday junction resolvase